MQIRKVPQRAVQPPAQAAIRPTAGPANTGEQLRAPAADKAAVSARTTADATQVLASSPSEPRAEQSSVTPAASAGASRAHPESATTGRSASNAALAGRSGLAASANPVQVPAQFPSVLALQAPGAIDRQQRSQVFRRSGQVWSRRKQSCCNSSQPGQPGGRNECFFW